MKQLTTVGFLHLKNVEGFDEDEHLARVQEFHSIPDSEKESLKWHHHNTANPNYYRGLAPFVDNDPSHKELFDMGGSIGLCSEEEKAYPLVEETPFPKGEQYAYLKTHYGKMYNLFHALGLNIISLLAIGLGKDRDFFRAWFEKDSLSTMRSIYYKPRSESTVKSEKLGSEDLKLTTPGHCDSGFVTILTTFGYPGLQVEIDGQFRSIKPERGCLVVNLGDTFERVTNFKLKATKHRVLDIGVTRYSSPFFFEPKYSAVIPRNMLAEKSEATAEPDIVYGVWLLKKILTYAEW